MIGRRVPWTCQRAIAFLAINDPVYEIGRPAEMRKLKRQARREDRRYQKSILREVAR